MKTTTDKLSAEKISRKDALKKAGMYAAFTAAASMVLLAPKVAMADSIPIPGDGFSAQNSTPAGSQDSFSPAVTKNRTPKA